MSAKQFANWWCNSIHQHSRTKVLTGGGKMLEEETAPKSNVTLTTVRMTPEISHNHELNTMTLQANIDDSSSDDGSNVGRGLKIVEKVK
jgi:hypothetical protein